MKTDLNKPLFAKLKFVRANDENCYCCVFYNRIRMACTAIEISCSRGHWEVDEVLPQSEVTFNTQQVEDPINSADIKMLKEEPKYFY